MELRHLRYFVAVAEEGHVTRAAERLGLQQPPLSQQIQALEAELGARLFLRLPRGVALTDAGTALLTEARAILEHVSRAAAIVRRTARGEEGRLAVGFTGSASFHDFVPRSIRIFRQAYPRLDVTLEESGTAELIAGLRARQIDVAFIRAPVGATADLTIIPLLREPMLLAVPADHPLSRRKTIPLASLAGESFILYRRPTGPGLYDGIITACQAAGFSPIIAQEAPRILSTLSLVSAGGGISLVPASLRRLGTKGVCYIRLTGPHLPTAPISLALRNPNPSETAQRFARQVGVMSANADGDPAKEERSGSARTRKGAEAPLIP